MRTKWFTNPFWIYIWAWVIIFAVYQINWSVNYINLSTNLVLFFGVTFFISILVGLIFEFQNKNRFTPIPINSYNLTFVVILWIGYILEFIYSRGIPLLSVISGSFGNYKDFTGIPTFHVILASFNIFYCIYLFHQYLSIKNKIVLIQFMISIFPILLVLNRGAIFIILLSCFIISFMHKEVIKLSSIVKIIAGLVLTFFLFGMVGNMRNELSKDDNEYILRLGGANEEFMEGNVPFEYYWGYLYMASPLGNLDHLVTNNKSNFKLVNVPSFIIYETMPDFLANRFANIFGLGEPEDNAKYLVVEQLNAPTVYFGSYILLGWVGMSLMFIFSTITIFCYLSILPSNSKFYLSGFAIIVSIIILNTFSNMWSATGTVLIWPIIFTLFRIIKIK